MTSKPAHIKHPGGVKNPSHTSSLHSINNETIFFPFTLYASLLQPPSAREAAKRLAQNIGSEEACSVQEAQKQPVLQTEKAASSRSDEGLLQHK